MQPATRTNRFNLETAGVQVMSRFKPLRLVNIFFARIFVRFFVPLAAVVALSGCAAIQVKLGMRVYLKKIPITSIQAKQGNGQGIAPGEKSPLIVTVTQPDGTVLTTEGKGHGKVLWKDLTVTPTVVGAGKKGVVVLSRDPRISDGKLPHVNITVPSHPDLHADLDIPIEYDRQFRANFSGHDGYSGTNGTSGMDGSSGSSGSFDPDHPSAGGDGGDGSNGSDGGHGGDGEDGPPVQVRVTLRPGSHPLLQIGVSGQGRESFFLVDPQGGSLTVLDQGGSGGSGGKGGSGGRGGSGGIGSPSGSSGRDGLSGTDGGSGSSGKGGSITLTYDPQAKPFLGIIKLSNQGGPAPVFKEEAVGPLW
jgi:hypothetical protein